MSVNQAVEQLLEVENICKGGAYSEDTHCVGLARVGHEDQLVVSGTMKDLLRVDFGEPLHSLVVAGELHSVELEHFKSFQGRQQM